MADDTYTVIAPVSNFSGTRAGVTFEEGEAEATEAQARELAWRGYEVPGLEEDDTDSSEGETEEASTGGEDSDSTEASSETSSDEQTGETEDADDKSEAPAELTHIKGIGPARKEDLEILGVETPHSLADADAADVADALDGVDVDDVEAWQEQV